jgi:hypothetical protein
MNWYTLLKMAALPQNWWHEYAHHLGRVLSFAFPEEAKFPHDQIGSTPVLLVGRVSKVTPTGYQPQKYEVDMNYRTLHFSFLVSRLGRLFDCVVTTDFSDQVAGAFGQGGEKYQFPMTPDASITKMEVYVTVTDSDGGFPVNAGRNKMILSSTLKGPQAVPHTAISMIREAIDNFHDFDDEAGEEPTPDDGPPQPSQKMPRNQLVGV